MLCQAGAQTTSKEVVAEDDDYYIEWITPEFPPYPPVEVDGKWVSWEEAFGPLPKPEPIAVKRPKNPKPPEPYDPNARWMEIKCRLAPQLYVDGKLKPEAEAMCNKARENALARTKKPAARPKVDVFDPRLTARNQNVQAELRDGPENGNGPLDNGNPRLELVQVDSEGFPGWTVIDLWLIDAPLGEWWNIFYAPVLKSTDWRPILVGPPDFTFDNVQWFVLAIPGSPPEGYFHAFMHQDVDRDGIPDGYEVMLFKTDPNNPDSDSTRDADGDGQPDFPNRANNWVVDGDEDFDGDGLSNLKELQIGTDPFVAEDYDADSDNDGLPDWAEYLIWIYQGIGDPGLRDDSDGDGVDNYTEVAVQTDPSWPDAVYRYWNFYFLPDGQRAFTLPPITIQHTAYTNAASTNNLIYDNVGTLGTYTHLEVRRNQDGDGNPLSGYDTILFGGAFQSPPSGMFMDMLVDGVEPSDAYISWGELLLTSTSLFADIWEEARVSDAIDQLNTQTIYVLQQRSMLRTVVRLRELQLAVDLSDSSVATRMRVRAALSQIHTETVLFRETSFKIAHYQGQNWWTRAGVWVSRAGRVASIFSIARSTRDVWTAAQPYIRDVQRRCDNNMDTAADLAVALGNLAAEFADGFMILNFWMVYWNQLIQFDGYDSQCW